MMGAVSPEEYATRMWATNTEHAIAPLRSVLSAEQVSCSGVCLVLILSVTGHVITTLRLVLSGDQVSCTLAPKQGTGHCAPAINALWRTGEAVMVHLLVWNNIKSTGHNIAPLCSVLSGEWASCSGAALWEAWRVDLACLLQ